MHLKKKTAILIKKTSSQVYKPKTYDKAITDQINSTK